MIGDHIDSVVLKIIIDQADFDRQATKAAQSFSNAFQNKIAKPGGGFYSKEELDKAYLRASKTLDAIATKQNSIDEKQRNARKNADKAADARADAASERAKRRSDSESSAKIRANERAANAEYRSLVARGKLESQITRENTRLQAQAAADRRRQNAADIADAQRYFRLQNAPLAKQPKVAPVSTIGVGKLGRVGAGIATMTGNYQMAGGMYAAANIMDSTGIAVSRATAALGGLAVAVPLALGGLALYGKELNKELADMSTLLIESTASTQELDKALANAMISAGKNAVEFNVKIEDVVKSYKQALSSGIDKEDLERFGKSAGTLATALGEDFGSAVNILTTFKDTYSLSVGELTKVNDILFNIVDKGKVNTKEMLNQLGRILAPAQAAGLSMEQLGGAYATMTRGMKNTQAVTSIGRIIADLVSPGKQATKAFDELGVTFGSTALEGRGFIGFIDELIAKTGGDSGAIARMFPEIQTQRGIQFLIQTRKLLVDNTSAMSAMGTATIAANRQLDTLWGTLDKVGTKVGTSLKQMGSDFADTLDTAFKYWRWKTGNDSSINPETPSGRQLNSILSSSMYGENTNFSEYSASRGGADNSLYLKQRLPEYIEIKQGLKYVEKTALGDFRYIASNLEELATNFKNYLGNKRDAKFGRDGTYIASLIEPTVDDTKDKVSAERRRADQIRESNIRERLTETQEEELEARKQYVAWMLEEGEQKKQAIAAELNAIIVQEESLRAAEKANRELDLKKGRDVPEFSRTTEDLKAGRERLADLYKLNEDAIDADIEAYKKHTKELEDSILKQRKRKDIEEEERDRESAARKGESLDNMRDQRALDLERKALQTQRAQLVNSDVKSQVLVGYDKYGKAKYKTSTQQGSSVNASKIAEIDRKLAEIDQAKFDRRYEHASYGGEGSPYSGGTSSSSIDARTGRISSLMGQRNALSATNSQYENWRAGGTDLYGKTKWVQDRPGVTDIYGNTKYQMPKEWEDNKSQIDTIDAEIKQLQSYREEYTSTLTKATDTTKTAFESMADASMLMADSVSSAWSFASGVYAMYRQAVQNNMMVNNNTTVPVTVNTATPTLDSSQVATAVKKTLDKQAANNTIKTSYPTTTSPLPTVQSTGTGTITSKKFGTVVIK
jgi:TP901 family phage tail tape measure protein